MIFPREQRSTLYPRQPVSRMRDIRSNRSQTRNQEEKESSYLLLKYAVDTKCLLKNEATFHEFRSRGAGDGTVVTVRTEESR
jgi:transposase